MLWTSDMVELIASFPKEYKSKCLLYCPKFTSGFPCLIWLPQNITKPGRILQKPGNSSDLSYNHLGKFPWFPMS